MTSSPLKKGPRIKYELLPNPERHFDFCFNDLFHDELYKERYDISHAWIEKELYAGRALNHGLYYILQNSNIPVDPGKWSNVDMINGYDLLSPYYKGFKKGKKYFKDAYPIPTEDIHRPISKYVNTLQQKFYHHEEETGGELGPWASWIEVLPLIADEYDFVQFGFRAGILSGLYDLIKLYPQAFEGKISFTEPCSCSKCKQQLERTSISIPTDPPQPPLSLVFLDSKKNLALRIMSALENSKIIWPGGNWVDKEDSALDPLYIEPIHLYAVLRDFNLFHKPGTKNGSRKMLAKVFNETFKTDLSEDDFRLRRIDLDPGKKVIKECLADLLK